MKVYTLMFHTDSSDSIVSVVSSKEIAKKRAELCAAKLYPDNEYHWMGHF